MKTIVKAVTAAAILGVSASANAFWGPGFGGPGYGLGDMFGLGDFDMGMRGSGYGRGYGRGYGHPYGYGGYPYYGGYGYPYGGYPAYGAPYAAPYGMPYGAPMAPAAPAEKAE
jgi:hypothetical protein